MKKDRRNNRPKNPNKVKAGKASAAATRRKAKEAAAKSEGGGAERRRTGPRCKAKSTTTGEQCKNAPIRGGTVCARHGGSAPQVRAKANQRLVAMILPALGELHKILSKSDTSDADRIKAITAVLNRTGYAERQEVDLGLREPTEWDKLRLTVTAASDDDVDPGEIDGAPTPLPRGHGDADDPEHYNIEQLRQSNRDEEDRNTRLPHGDHDVVSGKVVGPASGPNGSPGRSGSAPPPWERR